MGGRFFLLLRPYLPQTLSDECFLPLLVLFFLNQFLISVFPPRTLVFFQPLTSSFATIPSSLHVSLAIFFILISLVTLYRFSIAPVTCAPLPRRVVFRLTRPLASLWFVSWVLVASDLFLLRCESESCFAQPALVWWILRPLRPLNFPLHTPHCTNTVSVFLPRFRFPSCPSF